MRSNEKRGVVVAVTVISLALVGVTVTCGSASTPSSDFTKTQYPIVLTHGLLGLDSVRSRAQVALRLGRRTHGSLDPRVPVVDGHWRWKARGQLGAADGRDPGHARS